MIRQRGIVYCDIDGCGEPACFKIASQWSDARFWELKTYGFACGEHLRDVLRSAETRWLDYEPVTGESVGMIGIYRYAYGLKDCNLERYASIDEIEAEEP